MPVTTFATIVLAVLLAAALTVLAIAQFGAFTVLPVLISLALLARWAMTHVNLDDRHP